MVPRPCSSTSRRRNAWAPAKPSPDETLIRALARAHRWKRLLEDGKYRSAGDAPEVELSTAITYEDGPQAVVRSRVRIEDVKREPAHV